MKIRRLKEDLHWPIVRQGRRVGADAWRVWMEYEPPNYARCLGCGVYITKVASARFVLVHNVKIVRRGTDGVLVETNVGTTFKLICQECMTDDVFEEVRDLSVPCYVEEVTELYADTEGQEG